MRLLLSLILLAGFSTACALTVESERGGPSAKELMDRISLEGETTVLSELWADDQLIEALLG